MSVSDSAIAGAVSGVSARLITTPLDVIKIRFQLQLEPIRRSVDTCNFVVHRHEAKYKGVIQALRRIITEEGLSALWKGTVPGLAMYTIYGSVQFSCYDMTTKLLQNHFNVKNKVVRDFVGGCMGGCVASTVVHPLDVVRTRLAGQGEPKHYKTLKSAINLMYKEKGIRTFYRGIVPAVLVITPQAGMQFGFYSLYTYIWRENLAAGRKYTRANIESLICGSLAGITSKSIALPMDTVKKRLEVQGFEMARAQFGRVSTYSNLRDVLIKILKEEGLIGFYKGVMPGLIKASLTVPISFYTYEYTLYKLLPSLQKLTIT